MQMITKCFVDIILLLWIIKRTACQCTVGESKAGKNPNPVDKTDEGNARTFILNSKDSDYQIKCCGFLSSWKFYAGATAGTLFAQVWRPEGTDWKLIGQNTITFDEDIPCSSKSASTTTFSSISESTTQQSCEEQADTQQDETAIESRREPASEVDTISLAPSAQAKRRKISLEQLQKMQYEVLCCQKKNFKLQNMKLIKDLERTDLEKKNIELQNTKLALQIECLKQTVSQNENAFLALQAITDE